MANTVKLIHQDGRLYSYTPERQQAIVVPEGPFHSRIAYSAAHVVCDPLASNDPLSDAQIDWEQTMAYRRYLWSLGLSVAEAMDTAQRGMGLNWSTAKELIRRSIAEAKTVGGQVASGVGTDQLTPGPDVTIEDVVHAYREQIEFVEGEGGRVIIMASRALAACAKGPEDYADVYGTILQHVSQPVILHWLGEMFDPALQGYWGSELIDEAMTTCLQIIKENEAKVDGIKISLLDDQREIDMRRRLPGRVKMYTGDDFNYPDLIKGDEEGYSHALLGIFDAIAPAAAAAMHALDQGDLQTYDALLEKTVPLSRHIFQKPTFSYKTGVVFLAFLNGHQSHFRMVGGMEGARSAQHLSDLFVMADEAGLFIDPDLAAQRMKQTMALAGVE
ncbi:dihydrodipicolinate synthase family protein [Bacillaceae bacterium SIJ1]|uniref:dihydrodipicolinate synthase family protein n=1 Tax=Litoribacterium kuwaitense TaxID=1398745 RepID=UPI0013EC2173|nr:dihydrodipicolinate synthase family protein [Litoribacterium kuwaitense]NGP45178.1 dihydrodipicolinate synthase family protein [Litoribacterium kuwaitense]